MSGIYIEIPNIAGESKDDGHVDWLKVDSLSWGVSNNASADPSESGARVKGHPFFTGMSVSKKVDMSTALLMEACACGTALKAGDNITIDLMQPSGTDQKPYCYLKYILDEGLISDYSIQSSGEGDCYESFTITYSKITVEYNPEIDTAGGGVLPFGYDLRKHVAI